MAPIRIDAAVLYQKFDRTPVPIVVGARIVNLRVYLRPPAFGAVGLGLIPARLVGTQLNVLDVALLAVIQRAGAALRIPGIVATLSRSMAVGTRTRGSLAGAAAGPSVSLNVTPIVTLDDVQNAAGLRRGG